LEQVELEVQVILVMLDFEFIEMVLEIKLVADDYYGSISFDNYLDFN